MAGSTATRWPASTCSRSDAPAPISCSPTSRAPSPNRCRSAVTDDALLARARARIPGGVNSPVRAFDAVGGAPFFVARAQGAELIDTEGNHYLDYVQSWGASIL